MSPLLPLFPLDVVLFPGAPLPLHIFEPRYKEMIAECLETKAAFGVVRAKEENLAEIGCTAQILKLIKQYPDGRMDILTEGQRRFEIMELDRERSFLRADVLYLDDDASTPTAEEISRAVDLHREITALAGSEAGGEPERASQRLSFELAGTLPLDLDFKQALLGMKSEAERVPALASYLEALLPGLRRAIHTRQKAGGNGHVH